VNIAVRAMMMSIMIAFVARMIVMEVFSMMVAAIHAPSLASAARSGDCGRASPSR
jgi:hypothetical protein